MQEFLPIEADDLLHVFLFTSMWIGLYILVENLPIKILSSESHLSKKDKDDLVNRVISLIHGLVMLVLSGYHFYFAPGSCGGTNTNFEEKVMIASASYFLYDFLVMAYLGLLDLPMTFHHGICHFGMMTTVVMGVSANYTVNGMFIAECSNPSMHLRVLLRHFGMRYTRAYEACEISFVLLYCFGRFLMGFSQTWRTCMCQHNHPIIKFAALGLLFQSLYFIFQLAKILTKRMKEMALRKEMRVKMLWFTPLNQAQMEKLGLDISKDKNVSL